ncbi:glycerophosphoryl diester phosphodiesterase [Alkaliphilus metalliredigens QYMF]|uniref:Glycerophosphoryl diester phosphodiesterase n=1 Tax=Alkaliphilus metalliredigens (strain QYMF) TaxID=293826 RepID=A6TS02_ALKMQ|nr:glycerophosphodiester phosphodiesterase [Alkaliphilus metalliredigens]ABR48970.1 glycerophosphoryl diester phosphodiesterase [Alkaliphilus metalliredigens QYMF]
MFNKDKTTLNIGHRGAQALFPENTIISFDGSLELGADILEMDIRMTKDQVLVCHHDESIDRMSNGTGPIADFTYRELLAYNFAYGFQSPSGHYPYGNRNVNIPQLKDVLRNDYVSPLIFDLKDSGKRGYAVADQIFDLIKKHHLWDRVLIASFHDSVINYFRKISQNSVKTAMGNYEVAVFVVLAFLRLDSLFKNKATAILLPRQFYFLRLDCSAIIKAAHRHKLAIYYWTINDKQEMRRLINLGVDGIITDRPDRLKELLKRQVK